MTNPTRDTEPPVPLTAEDEAALWLAPGQRQFTRANIERYPDHQFPYKALVPILDALDRLDAARSGSQAVAGERLRTALCEAGRQAVSRLMSTTAAMVRGTGVCEKGHRRGTEHFHFDTIHAHAAGIARDLPALRAALSQEASQAQGHGPEGNEGYCRCGTFVGHNGDWSAHGASQAQGGPAPELRAALGFTDVAPNLTSALKIALDRLEAYINGAPADPDDPDFDFTAEDREFIAEARAALATAPGAGDGLAALDVERLARAEHASYAREPGARRIEWDELTPNEKSMWRRHAEVRAAEYARLRESQAPGGE